MFKTEILKNAKLALGEGQMTGPTPPFLSKWKEKVQGATSARLCEPCGQDSASPPGISVTPDCLPAPAVPCLFFFFTLQCF